MEAFRSVGETQVTVPISRTTMAPRCPNQDAPSLMYENQRASPTGALQTSPPSGGVLVTHQRRQSWVSVCSQGSAHPAELS